MLLPTSYPHTVKWYPSNNDVGPNRESLVTSEGYSARNDDRRT